jgi:hypothetical protein
MGGVCKFDLIVQRDWVDCGSKGFDCRMWQQLGFFESPLFVCWIGSDSYEIWDMVLFKWLVRWDLAFLQMSTCFYWSPKGHTCDTGYMVINTIGIYMRSNIY